MLMELCVTGGDVNGNERELTGWLVGIDIKWMQQVLHGCLCKRAQPAGKWAQQVGTGNDDQ